MDWVCDPVREILTNSMTQNQNNSRQDRCDPRTRIKNSGVVEFPGWVPCRQNLLVTQMAFVEESADYKATFEPSASGVDILSAWYT
jgi:hypothetical protein